MKTILRSLAVLLLLACGLPEYALGQHRSSIRASRDLRSITRLAAYIFAGRVTCVEYLPPQVPGHFGVMRISFQVEQGLRGTRGGTQFVMRQWIGLWNEGERYRVGERVVLFLYPTSKLGLTSPVGGAQGRFPLDDQDRLTLPDLRLLGSPTVGPPKQRVALKDFLRSIRRAEQE